MSDSAKKLLVVVVAVALLGVYIWWYSRGSSAGEDQAGEMVWVCQNRECGNQFRMTQKEMTAFYAKNSGQAVPCPKCGKSEQVVRGIECPHCKKTCTKPRGESECPSCGKDLYQPPK